MSSASSNTSGGTSTVFTRAVNDAFGNDSPHWNLPFPPGRLTAAEILTYCPHWLKSIDVVHRFVTNGARSKILANMLGHFRYLPSGIIKPNSVCIMMQCAMRAAGWENWRMGLHHEFYDAHSAGWDGDDLDVSDFRAPYITHPKKAQKKIENVAAGPVQFRDLAQDVKHHPTGYDALDLTRCVIYAVNHPRESWLFPDDFESLVNKLGGPRRVYHSHSDTQIFERALVDLFKPDERHKLSIIPLTAPRRLYKTAATVSARNPVLPLPLVLPSLPASKAAATSKKRSSKKRGFEEAIAGNMRSSTTGRARRSGRIAAQDIKNLREPDTDSDTLKNGPHYKEADTDSDEFGPPTKKRRPARARTPESDFVGNNTSDSDSLQEAHSPIEHEISSPELTSRPPVRASAQKSRRLTKKTIRKETPKTRSGKGQQSFSQIANDTNPAYAPIYPSAHAPSYPPVYGATHPFGNGPYYPSAHAPNYPSAHAPNYPSAHAPNYPSAHAPSYQPTQIPRDQSASAPSQLRTHKAGVVPTDLIDPALLKCAAAHVAVRPPPILAPAPVLSRDRPKVDAQSIFLYAAEGCTTIEEMWASALSSTRFGGPRTSAPYRELYRLTEPEPWDVSDWAENIRWAKEQYRAFGVTTWTEYDYHLEQITQIRRQTMWVSEVVGNVIGPIVY